jgi:hypothetical protein
MATRNATRIPGSRMDLFMMALPRDWRVAMMVNGYPFTVGSQLSVPP